MIKRVINVFLCIFVVSLFLGCVTMGSERLVMKEGTFASKYSSIKKIVMEEAANNGFSTLTSEIKPSKYNDWEGRLFFQLVTPNGTDQLFVDFKKKPEGVSVWVHGAGTRGNANSAAKAISARLNKL
ncbi:MAG: hypothetical protein NTW65_12690 [Deltaproteobacteria bacterium]|nr:hypothetical protein [Deltaproteobacteria bacterium]